MANKDTFWSLFMEKFAGLKAVESLLGDNLLLTTFK